MLVLFISVLLFLYFISFEYYFFVLFLSAAKCKMIELHRFCIIIYYVFLNQILVFFGTVWMFLCPFVCG